jgi:hypothetical protein
MDYSNLTIKSNIFLKRFTHTSRHIRCSNLVNQHKFKNFLDFGSGDGQLFQYLKISSKKRYFAYEPFIKMQNEFFKNKFFLKGVGLITNKKKLKKNFYDLVIINEVLEHLPNKKIFEVIKTIKYITKKNSTIIISVPIEVGLSSLVKNFIRLVFNSTHEGLTFKNLIRSIFVKKINRGNKNYFKSHIGFNYYELRNILNNNFSIINVSYTPFNFLKSFLNSQIFFVCKL